MGFFWLYGKFVNQEQADLIQLRMVQWVFKILHVLAGINITVIGEENVPKDEAVLYVANHRSKTALPPTPTGRPPAPGVVLAWT